MSSGRPGTGLLSSARGAEGRAAGARNPSLELDTWASPLQTQAEQLPDQQCYASGGANAIFQGRPVRNLFLNRFSKAPLS